MGGYNRPPIIFERGELKNGFNGLKVKGVARVVVSDTWETMKINHEATKNTKKEKNESSCSSILRG
jgi:hypothetical protein